MMSREFQHGAAGIFDCRRPLPRAAVSFCLLIVVCTAGAEEPPASQPPPPKVRNFELTAFLGYQFGGEFDLTDPNAAPGGPSLPDAEVVGHSAYTLALDIRADEERAYEILYSRQPTRLRSATELEGLDLDIEYLHVGGTVLIEQSAASSTYVVGTIGATRLTLDAPGASEVNDLSVSLGLGLRVPVNDRFHLRMEGRGYFTFLDSDSALFCGSGQTGGTCLIRRSGSMFSQFTVMLGAAFRF